MVIFFPNVRPYPVIRRDDGRICANPVGRLPLACCHVQLGPNLWPSTAIGLNMEALEFQKKDVLAERECKCAMIPVSWILNILDITSAQTYFQNRPSFPHLVYRARGRKVVKQS